MSNRAQGATRPAGHDVPRQIQLAALWTSFMFLYVYVDILALYQPGVLDEVLAGRVWELEINQTWAVGALVLMALPILMIAMSTILPRPLNRVTNIAVAALYAVVSIANAIGETWVTYATTATGLEVIVLAAILSFAWSWPTRPAATLSSIAATPPQPLAGHRGT